jgi:hypothetical protein
MRVAPSATVMPHVNWLAHRFRICRHSAAMIARLVGLRRSLVRSYNQPSNLATRGCVSENFVDLGKETELSGFPIT